MSFFAVLAVAICYIGNGLVAYTITQVFPVMLATLKAHGFLYLMASIEVAAVLSVVLLFPETKVSVSPCVCVCWVVGVGIIIMLA